MKYSRGYLFLGLMPAITYSFVFFVFLLARLRFGHWPVAQQDPSPSKLLGDFYIIIPLTQLIGWPCFFMWVPATCLLAKWGQLRHNLLSVFFMLLFVILWFSTGFFSYGTVEWYF